MVDGFTVDKSEVDALAADLGAVRQVAGRYIRAAVEVSARHVKDDWKDETQGISGARAFPFSIGYDVNTFHGFGVSVVQAEIGPDKERAQGALGNLIEYGGETSGGLMSNRGAGAAVTRGVADDFERGLSRALDDAEHAAGVDGSVARSAGAVIRGSYR